MKLEVMTTSTSKKGVKYLQVKVLEGEMPATGIILVVQPSDKEAAK